MTTLFACLNTNHIAIQKRQHSTASFQHPFIKPCISYIGDPQSAASDSHNKLLQSALALPIAKWRMPCLVVIM